MDYFQYRFILVKNAVSKEEIIKMAPLFRFIDAAWRKAVAVNKVTKDIYEFVVNSIRQSTCEYDIEINFTLVNWYAPDEGVEFYEKDKKYSWYYDIRYDAIFDKENTTVIHLSELDIYKSMIHEYVH